MLGQTIREARLRKGLTQDRLARMAGVSRRHLAALEKGANVSVSILQRVAAVLELTEIHLGTLAVRPADLSKVNLPLLTDAIREARADAERANAILARAQDLLGGGEVSTSFPRMPVRQLDPLRIDAGVVRERPEELEVETAGIIRQGQAIDEGARERVSLPRTLVDEGEIVFRFRGEGLEDHGIREGDLLVVEPRTRGRAASGELVIGRIGELVWIGRWWQKRGAKGLVSNSLSQVVTGRGGLKVLAAVNQIIRGI